MMKITMMKRIYNIIGMGAAAVMLMQGCKSEKIEYVSIDGLSPDAVGYLSVGGFDLRVADYAEEITSTGNDPDFTENTASSASFTRAGSDFGATTEASGDYIIRIRNIKTGDEKKMTYDELKQAQDGQVPLTPGTYVVSAESPDYEGYMAGKTVASWETPVYYGETTATIVSKQETTASGIVCRLANLKATVSVTPDLAGLFMSDTECEAQGKTKLSVILSVGEPGDGNSLQYDRAGMEAVKAGRVQNDINESGKARHIAVSRRKEVLLGTNQYPNFTETAGEKRPIEAGACCHHHEGTCEHPFATLNTTRAASEFEALRLQTEQSGRRPKAFMLTIGNLAMRQARAQFSCNFLACAGYEVIDNLGFKTVEEGVEAALAAKADIVVLCSSDDEYAEYAIPAFKALDGRAMFVVAGAPACMDDLKAAGIENFIHVRVNVLDTLKEYTEKLGIK